MELYQSCKFLHRTTAEIQHDLKNAIRSKRAAKKAPSSTLCQSSTYPDVSPADATGIQDDASSALCNAMGDLGIGPVVIFSAWEASPNLPILSHDDLLPLSEYSWSLTLPRVLGRKTEWMIDIATATWCSAPASRLGKGACLQP